MRKPNLLFLCTGNSCRSQMAEAWCRAIASHRVNPFSAGVVASGMNPKMLQVMREVGLEPTIHQSSKTLAFLLDAGLDFDVVVTVCGHAHDSCIRPHPAMRTVVHRAFADPPDQERHAPDADAALDNYRRVRDEIRDFILSDAFTALTSTAPDAAALTAGVAHD
ncbi:MAG: arsenate reductase ArsC [Planctomycetes bacterium]|nr:arsenate reductase ArsC [Nannocystis sp.]MBA3546996.1 arsenate reductase ArsC [Nannocystis sp.]MBA3846135.1 arsenate reductase ArsC [Planctomycetota bacterium]